MYVLRDQVRDVALGYADIHLQQRTARPRAICEFDGQKWSPIELINEGQLNQLQPTLQTLSLDSKDSGYSSNVSSTGHRSPQNESSSILSTESREPESAEELSPLSAPTTNTTTTFGRSSSFHIPPFDVEGAETHSAEMPEEFEDIEDSDEAEDVLRELLLQQRAESAVAGGPRRPSILASATYQRNLINFSDLQVSEVDLSEERADCDIVLARSHIMSAFPKQFAAEANSAIPLTSFSIYSDAEDYVEMLHVVLVLESRTVYWKLLGPSDQTPDKVTKLPYCWEAEVDLPPLSLDEPTVTHEVECLIMGRPTYSTVMCDNHNAECRKCKGLASNDDCFACDGSGVFKKKPCVMCSGRGKYFCTTCENTGHVSCQLCNSKDNPKALLRQAYITCTRETVVSPTMEVEGDDKITLIATAKALAKKTVEAEEFADGTLPVAACGVLIRQRGHIICATDLDSGARGLFEVVADLDRVEFKGQLPPIPKISSRPASIRSNASRTSVKSNRSWFRKNKAGAQEQQEEMEADGDDAASIRSTASTTSTRMKNFFKRNK